MLDVQVKFLETMNRVMPVMTELEQEKLLAFGEGLAFMARERQAERAQDSA